MVASRENPVVREVQLPRDCGVLSVKRHWLPRVEGMVLVSTDLKQSRHGLSQSCGPTVCLELERE